MNCQKCRQPLKLDGSLEDLNPAAYDLLVCKRSLCALVNLSNWSSLLVAPSEANETLSEIITGPLP